MASRRSRRRAARLLAGEQHTPPCGCVRGQLHTFFCLIKKGALGIERRASITTNRLELLQLLSQLRAIRGRKIVLNRTGRCPQIARWVASRLLYNYP